MKKIAAGYYVTSYNGHKIEVCKVDEVSPACKGMWFAIIDEDKNSVGDWAGGKAKALEAAMYMIDHPEEYKL